MSERSTVRFTQAGKPISCSAGFIVGVCPWGLTVLDNTAKQIRFGCGVLTNLGLMMVDQDQFEALRLWNAALVEPEPLQPIMQFRPMATPLGNDAEF